MLERVKKLFQATDMTVGEPWKQIVMFTLPMLIGNIAQQLYSTVDSVVVGKYVGDNALSAVGSSAPILNLLLVLFVGISMGAGILVSQYFGAKQREELSYTIGNCITLTAIASLITCADSVSFAFGRMIFFSKKRKISSIGASILIVIIFSF